MEKTTFNEPNFAFKINRNLWKIIFTFLKTVDLFQITKINNKFKNITGINLNIYKIFSFLKAFGYKPEFFNEVNNFSSIDYLNNILFKLFPDILEHEIINTLFYYSKFLIESVDYKIKFSQHLNKHLYKLLQIYGKNQIHCLFIINSKNEFKFIENYPYILKVESNSTIFTQPLEKEIWFKKFTIKISDSAALKNSANYFTCYKNHLEKITIILNNSENVFEFEFAEDINSIIINNFESLHSIYVFKYSILPESLCIDAIKGYKTCKYLKKLIIENIYCGNYIHDKKQLLEGELYSYPLKLDYSDKNSILDSELRLYEKQKKLSFDVYNSNNYYNFKFVLKSIKKHNLEKLEIYFHKGHLTKSDVSLILEFTNLKFLKIIIENHNGCLTQINGIFEIFDEPNFFISRYSELIKALLKRNAGKKLVIKEIEFEQMIQLLDLMEKKTYDNLVECNLYMGKKVENQMISNSQILFPNLTHLSITINNLMINNTDLFINNYVQNLSINLKNSNKIWDILVYLKTFNIFYLKNLTIESELSSFYLFNSKLNYEIFSNLISFSLICKNEVSISPSELTTFFHNNKKLKIVLLGGKVVVLNREKLIKIQNDFKEIGRNIIILI